MASKPDFERILLQLIGSLTLADHMGDASNDMREALKLARPDLLAKIDKDEEESDDTLVGTELWSGEDDGEAHAEARREGSDE